MVFLPQILPVLTFWTVGFGPPLHPWNYWYSLNIFNKTSKLGLSILAISLYKSVCKSSGKWLIQHVLNEDDLHSDQGTLQGIQFSILVTNFLSSRPTLVIGLPLKQTLSLLLLQWILLSDLCSSNPGDRYTWSFFLVYDPICILRGLFLTIFYLDLLPQKWSFYQKNCATKLCITSFGKS